MLYVKRRDVYVIRFEDGEVFPDGFLELLASEAIAAGEFTGIGAMRQARIAFFNTDSKTYEDRDYVEQMEVLALVGNVAIHNDEPLVHAHITLSRSDFSVLGGHLRRGVVRPTLEVTLRTLAEPLRRAVDPTYGLPTLDLH